MHFENFTINIYLTIFLSVYTFFRHHIYCTFKAFIELNKVTCYYCAGSKENIIDGDHLCGVKHLHGLIEKPVEDMSEGWSNLQYIQRLKLHIKTPKPSIQELNKLNLKGGLANYYKTMLG